jgi:hypothetical protein
MNFYLDCTATILTHFGFDLDGSSADDLVGLWRDRYPHQWLLLAAIESIYQGRYKALSVDRVLVSWQRQNRPKYHFTSEYERLILKQLPNFDDTLTQEVEAITLDPPLYSDAAIPGSAIIPPRAPSLRDNPEFVTYLAPFEDDNDDSKDIESAEISTETPTSATVAEIDAAADVSYVSPFYHKLKAVADGTPIPSAIPGDVIANESPSLSFDPHPLPFSRTEIAYRAT